jgi:nitrite reductase/ring-hydroxylating ferredoxin subunit
MIYHDVCSLASLDDPGSVGFSLGEGDWPLRGFLVRRGDRVAAYVNRCPHAGHPLDWIEGRFLTRDRQRILCASHGAEFELATGLCVAGPCPGRRLTPLPLRIDGHGIVQVAAPADASD